MCSFVTYFILNNNIIYLCVCAQLDYIVENMLKGVPKMMQEACSRLTVRQWQERPTAQLMHLIKYFQYVIDIYFKLKKL